MRDRKIVLVNAIAFDKRCVFYVRQYFLNGVHTGFYFFKRFGNCLFLFECNTRVIYSEKERERWTPNARFCVMTATVKKEWYAVSQSNRHKINAAVKSVRTTCCQAIVISDTQANADFHYCWYQSWPLARFLLPSAFLFFSRELLSEEANTT